MKKLLLCLLSFGMLLAAQETRSIIFGRVLDPQGAAVAGATVLVVNTETKNTARLKSNATGYYEANLLLPGAYRVTAETAGFKTSTRSGITLGLGGRLEINVNLELGAVAESVSVTAEAPILDTNAVSSGRLLENRSLMDLPVLGNNIILLAKMSPGIQHGTGTNNYVGLHSNPTASSKGGAEGNVGGNEWSIDGMPNTGNDRKTAYMPYSDTVQEYRVETANFDAAVGHSTGSSFHMISKTGTNEYHGTATEQHWQQRWNGSPFFVKQLYYRNIAAAEARGDAAAAAQLRAQDKQPSGHSHNWAGTIGGPVRIPGLFNGKNRLFFFFAYNGFKDTKTEDATQINRTIPTMANRRGDFSQLLNVNARYQIYDPLTVRPDPARPTHYLRDPIPGNILPQSRVVNPTYNAYLKLLPVPNNDPTDPSRDPVNNYLAVGTPYFWDYWAYSNRVDFNATSRHRFFGRWSWNDFMEDRVNWTYESARGLNTNGLNRHNLGGSADWVWTRSATTVFDFAFALNEFREGSVQPVPAKYKPSDVGLPAYLDAKAGDLHLLPQMSWSGYSSASPSGIPSFTRYRLATFKAEVSHVRGKHSVRSGFDARHHFRTGGGGGNTSGNFSFSNQFTRRNDDTNTPAGDYGHSWAAFMMGLPNSLTIAGNDSYATHTPYYAGYVQESWRLKPTLTLNLGLRLEYEMGPTERYNRMIGAFDANATLPITAAAQSAYAAAPVPERAASDFKILGGSVYPGVNGKSRRLWAGAAMLMPRAAFSWQANSKTVLRFGYGLFFDSLNVLNDGPIQTGFSRSTSTTVTNDFGMNWLVGNPKAGVSPLTDPFPVRADGSRFDVPTRDALGLMTSTGRSFSYESPDIKRARLQRWRISVQRQLSPNMAIEAAYTGSYADRNYIAINLNPLPEQYWASGLTRNDAIATNLNANVANPFRLANFQSLQQSMPVVWQDMTTQSFYTSSTISKNRLLRPYPHLSGLTLNNAPNGAVRTDSLQLSFERRFSKGFNLNAGYTRLRDRTRDWYANEFDPEPMWREGVSGRPHRFFASGIYQFPFGKGRHFLKKGVPGALLGGFQAGATYEWQPGALLNFGNVFYYGEDIEAIASGPRTLDRWFNTDNFERNQAKGPTSYHRRVFPSRVTGLRQDMLNQWNVNLQREFRLHERLAFQVRLEAINLQNRAQFAVPEMSPYSTNFGRVMSQTDGTPRFIQIQGRLRW